LSANIKTAPDGAARLIKISDTGNML
jgi:hypothetical protein